MNLEQRVERLEQQNRRLKSIVILALGVLVVGLFIDRSQSLQAKPADREIMRAGKFELVNGDGKVQAVLEATKHGASFELRDGQGNPFYNCFGYEDVGGTFYLKSKDAFLNAAANEVGVNLALFTDRPRVSMAVETKADSPGELRAEKFKLVGGKDKVFGEWLREGYGAALVLSDSHGTEQSRLYAADDPDNKNSKGRGGLSLKHDGDTRVYLGIAESGSGQIELKNKDDKVHFERP